MLLMHMVKRSPKPVCLWCEHHEDFLLELEGDTFHAYQVKTRRPPLSAWDLNNEDFTKAIGKFIALDQKYPDKIVKCYFVSNHPFLDSEDVRRITLCPKKCIDTVSSSPTFEDLSSEWQARIATLSEKVGFDSQALMRIFSKLKLVEGPPLNGFDAVIALDSVGKHPSCRNFNQRRLISLRDELMHLIAKASSISYESESMAWQVVGGEGKDAARLAGKRIIPLRVESLLAEDKSEAFRFSPIGSALAETKSSGLSVLEKKLTRGGLEGQIEVMRRRTLSAERHLLVLANGPIQDPVQLVDQLDAVVHGVCNDERLIASEGGAKPFGPKMYAGVVSELRKKAREEKDLVFGQPPEFLMGVAGLLTEACKVWWSPEFDILESA